ncbi:MAG: hypothetical protein H8D46_01070 [FCB group bacterium]|nr:hypothetical protein [FCB group bacterium]
MKNIYLICIVLLGFQACDDKLAVYTDKYTYYDDISDIAYMNGYIYSTNYDLSGNSGPQIDLLRFSGNGSVLENAFPLELNGQGYMAMAGDGQDIFLQSRRTNLLFRYSAIGEFASMVDDQIEDNWFASGISYIPEKDSLFVLYRNLNQLDQYRGRMLSKWFVHDNGTDVTGTWTFLDTGYHGAYCMTYKDGWFYILGVDVDGLDILFRTGYDFQPEFLPLPLDSTVVGVTFKGDSLVFAHRNRSFEFLGVY